MKLTVGFPRFLFLLVLVSPLALQANPKTRRVFFNVVFTNAIGTQSNNLPSRQSHCDVCHYDFQSGGDPWNPLGLAVKNSGFPLNNDTGRSNAIMYASSSTID